MNRFFGIDPYTPSASLPRQ